MKTIKLIAALSLVLTACSDDAGTPGDARIDGGDIDAAVPLTFKQVEHLARPGIAEALLLSNDFLAGYNATAPTFAGVPSADLGMVVAQAKTVLKALYLGGCLLNGVPTVVPDLQPAGIPCHAEGGAIFTENALTGVTLTATSMQKAQEYADKVFDQFVPDVMRIDMSVATSYYQSLCGDANTKPLLCGGRALNDDTIDITYDYLLNGAGTPSDATAAATQHAALVSDGVNFDDLVAGTQRKGNRLPPAVGRNDAQGHPPVVLNAFPYSADPL